MHMFQVGMAAKLMGIIRSQILSYTNEDTLNYQLFSLFFSVSFQLVSLGVLQVEGFLPGKRDFIAGRYGDLRGGVCITLST